MGKKSTDTPSLLRGDPQFVQYLAQRLVCTGCGAGLRSNGAGFSCPSCGRCCEVRCGVPVLWDGGDDFKIKEAEYYGREALDPSPSSVFRGYYRRSAYENRINAVALSFIRPQSLVLTLGGGDGRHGVALRRMGHAVLETDLAPEAGLVAARRFEAAGCVGPWAVAAVDAEYIPFAAGTFDAVHICAALHQMPDYGRVAREVGRVLKPGGVLVLAAEPNAWFYRVLRPLAQALGIRSRQLWDQSVGDESNRGVGYRDILQFCGRAGLEPVYLQPKYFLTGCYYQATEAAYRLLPERLRHLAGTHQWEIELLTLLDHVIGLVPVVRRYPFYWTAVLKKT